MLSLTGRGGPRKQTRGCGPAGTYTAQSGSARSRMVPLACLCALVPAHRRGVASGRAAWDRRRPGTLGPVPTRWKCLEFLVSRGDRPMYEKILVAVDHSESTPRVLEAARGLASLSQGEVWVIHLRERETVGKTGLLTSRESAEEADADVTSAV